MLLLFLAMLPNWIIVAFVMNVAGVIRIIGVFSLKREANKFFEQCHALCPSFQNSFCIFAVEWLLRLKWKEHANSQFNYLSHLMIFIIINKNHFKNSKQCEKKMRMTGVLRRNVDVVILLLIIKEVL